MRRVAAFTITVLPSLLLALFFLNRPRFWWQEAVCNLASYWIVPLLISFLFCAGRLARSRFKSVVSWLALVAHVYVINSVVHTLSPYIVFNHWRSLVSQETVSLRALYIDNWRDSDNASTCLSVLETYKPSIVVISGDTKNLSLAGFFDAQYRFTMHGSYPTDGNIEVFSSVPLLERGNHDLGINAMSGGVVTARLSPQKTVEIGILVLEPSLSKEQFERNRVSARRLASLMRNSAATRIVMANFNATPFSQLTSMYVDQARMRSLMFGRGMFKTFNMNSPWVSFAASNILVSKDVEPIHIEQFVCPDRPQASWFFEIRVPLIDKKVLPTALPPDLGDEEPQ